MLKVLFEMDTNLCGITRPNTAQAIPTVFLIAGKGNITAAPFYSKRFI